jgi:hypothetical protein
MLEAIEVSITVEDMGGGWPRPWVDVEGGDVTHPTQVPPSPQNGQSTRRWTLLAAAPEWFRRVWNERSREAPKGEDPSQPLRRRIVYL